MEINQSFFFLQDIYHLSNLLSLRLFNVSEACLVKLTLTTARILNIYFTSSWEQFFTLQELHPLQAVPASLMNFFDNLVMFHIFPVSSLFLSSSVLYRCVEVFRGKKWFPLKTWIYSSLFFTYCFAEGLTPIIRKTQTCCIMYWMQDVKHCFAHIFKVCDSFWEKTVKTIDFFIFCCGNGKYVRWVKTCRNTVFRANTEFAQFWWV